MYSKEQRPIVLIALVMAACLLGDSMLYIVLPAHWQDMGLTSLWQIGVILSVNRLVRLPLNPLVSRWYRNISAKSGMSLAIVLAVLTTAGYGVVHNFYVLVLLRCFWGLAWTFLRLGAYFTIIDHSTDANRGHCMGLYNGLYRLGSLVGMLAGGFLAESLGVLFTCLLFSALTLCSLPVVRHYVRDTEAGLAAGAAKEKDFRLFSNYRVLAALLAGTFLAMLYQGMFTSTLSYLVKLHYPTGLTIAGFVLGASSLGGVLQAIRWGWEPWLAPAFGRLADGNWGRHKVLVISTFAAALGFGAISLPLAPWLWMGVVLVVQLTATSLTTVADTLAADVAVGSAKVKVMTLYSLLIDVGSALGPLVAFFANQYMAPAASCYIAVAVLLVLTFGYLPAAFRDKA